MNSPSKLENIFNDCRKQNISVILSESCCHTSSTIKNFTNNNYIIAKEKQIDNIMKEIEEDGSAIVTWYFGGDIGYKLVDIFSSYDYIVNWHEDMEKKIQAVVDMDDIPKVFLKEWYSDKINSDVIFTKEEEQDNIFESDPENTDIESSVCDKDEPILDILSDDDSEDSSESE